MKSHPIVQIPLIALAAAALVYSLQDPIYPRDQLLQHIPTPIFLGILLWLAARRILSDALMGILLLSIRWPERHRSLVERSSREDGD